MKELANTPAIAVFLGTLPLLLTLAWGMLTNNRALDLIGKRLDGIDKRLDRMDNRLDHIETDVHSIDLRLTKVETRLEGGRLVMGD